MKLKRNVVQRKFRVGESHHWQEKGRIDMKRRSFVGASGAAAAIAVGLPLRALAQATQGVTKDEVLVGTIQDLSGPTVANSKPGLNGMTLRVEQINAAGGINGRKIKFLVEDSAYDPKRGVLAAQKLVTNDRVFAMVGVFGTPVALAAAPLIVEHGVPDLFPISAHRGNWDPFNRLKFAVFAPLDVGTKTGLTSMIKRNGYQRLGILYQDDELGIDILRATEDTLKSLNMTLVEKASYKRGATDFSSQVQRLVAANVQVIVMGSAMRETIAAVAAARQLGYTGDFMGSQAPYLGDTARLGGPPMEGFYAIGEYPMMYRDDPKNSRELNEWMDAYTQRFSLAPDVFSATGWVSMDIFASALKSAGPEPTTEGLIRALERLHYGKTFLGNPEYTFSPTRRQGGAQIRVNQIKNSRWVPVTDYLELL